MAWNSEAFMWQMSYALQASIYYHFLSKFFIQPGPSESPTFLQIPTKITVKVS